MPILRIQPSRVFSGRRRRFKRNNPPRRRPGHTSPLDTSAASIQIATEVDLDLPRLIGSFCFSSLRLCRPLIPPPLSLSLSLFSFFSFYTNDILAITISAHSRRDRSHARSRDRAAEDPLEFYDLVSAPRTEIDQIDEYTMSTRAAGDN